MSVGERRDLRQMGHTKHLVKAGKLPADETAFLAAGDPTWSGLARCRERDECREKLVRLGIVLKDRTYKNNA